MPRGILQEDASTARPPCARRSVAGGVADVPSMMRWVAPVASALSALSAAPERDAAGDITVFFASGCFWGRQHDLAEFERQTLGRADSEVTAIGGYAGSADSSSPVCYYNQGGVGIYSKLGHAEAVSIRLPPTAATLESAARVFFSSFVPLGNRTFGREDVFDQGPGYRAFIALPGGLASPLLSAVRRANLHGMSLVAGNGSDPDTFGTNRVYVLDSSAYTFHQAEVCLQFHNNQTGDYPPSYHRLREVLLANKRLRNDTGCPSNFVC